MRSSYGEGKVMWWVSERKKERTEKALGRWESVKALKVVATFVALFVISNVFCYFHFKNRRTL